MKDEKSEKKTDETCCSCILVHAELIVSQVVNFYGKKIACEIVVAADNFANVYDTI